MGTAGGTFSRILTHSVNDARYQGNVKVHYGLHRLLGKQGKLIRKVRYGGKSFLDVEVDGVRHTIHAWMADESHCQSLTFGDDPVSSVETLREISVLLDREL